MRVAPCFAALACALSAAPSAFAFSYETPLSDGCHERVTNDALRAVRREGRAKALNYSREERALANDRSWQARLGEEIRAASGQLYEDDAAVAEIEAYLERAVAEAAGAPHRD